MMDGVSNFFHMGGHGAFIWPSYLIVFAVLAALLVFSRRFVKTTESELQALDVRPRKRPTTESPADEA